MPRLFNHENNHAKTYASRANAQKAMEKYEADFTYMVVLREDGRYQPIVTNAGMNAAWFAYNGFCVTGFCVTG